jgi:hypothetical protein
MPGHPSTERVHKVLQVSRGEVGLGQRHGGR